MTTTLRWMYLIIAGSMGPFGMVVLTAYLLCYMVGEQSYGVPLIAPFAPLVKSDLYDSLVKANLYTLNRRPKVLKAKEKVRLERNED